MFQNAWADAAVVRHLTQPQNLRKSLLPDPVVGQIAKGHPDSMGGGFRLHLPMDKVATHLQPWLVYHTDST